MRSPSRMVLFAVLTVALGWTGLFVGLFVRSEPSALSMTVFTLSAVLLAAAGFEHSRRNAKKGATQKKSLWESRPMLVGGMTAGLVFVVEEWQHGVAIMAWLNVAIGLLISVVAVIALLEHWRQGRAGRDGYS